jgi:TRAP-type C4-dicarboxylate transport system permease small subunit
MNNVTRIIRGASRVGEEGAALLLYGMMAIVVSNVVLGLLGSPLRALFEIMAALSVGIIGLALAGSQRTKSHISIDLMKKTFPQRVQDGLAAVLLAVVTVFWVVVLFALSRYTLLQLSSGTASDILRLPTWPQLVVLMTGVVLLILVLVVDFSRQVKSTVTGKEIEAVW